LVSIRLELAGYHAISARSGYQALERIRATKPEGLILDIGLPDIDGFGVLQELKRIHPALPVCMLTARKTAAEVQRAILMGARSYLTKPFDDKVLLARIDQMIRPPTRTDRTCYI
jgi:DNA-binding response OmpR family regulator